VMLLVARISPAVAEAAVPMPIELNCEFCVVLVNVAAEPVVFWLSVGKVQLVNVPLEGVPNTPPLTTGDPAVPTLTARAVATLVPRPDTPVLMGSPVQLVNVPLEGVPSAGVTSVGDVAKTLLPVPVLVTLTTFLLASNAKAVEAVNPLWVMVPVVLSVVNAPAAAVVAPTVPLSGPAKAVAVMVVPVIAAAAVPPIAGGEAK